MKRFDQFLFAAPPRTGISWFLRAASFVGLNSDVGHPYAPFLDADILSVTIVRHPYDWLGSLYFTPPRQLCGVQDIEYIKDLARRASRFGEFIRLCSCHPNLVAGVFDEYRASSIIRLEDFPWAVIELFKSVGVASETARRIVDLHYSGGIKFPVDGEVRLKALIVGSESDFCCRFDYY